MKPTRPTILVVDDDPNDLLFIEGAFRFAGCAAKIQTVEGGDDAVAYLNGEGKYADRNAYEFPHFVITDLKMPGINGFGLLEYLKRNPGSATIPTVVLSGSQDDDDIKKAYLLGAASYHVKPSDPTALRALVKALHEYWTRCELPAANDPVRHAESGSPFKLGTDFFPRPDGPAVRGAG